VHSYQRQGCRRPQCKRRNHGAGKKHNLPDGCQATQKIIQKCKVVAEKEEVELRQSYSRIFKQLSRVQLFRNHPTNKAKAKKADKKVKATAGRLVRELERKLTPNSQYQGDLVLFLQILSQKKDSKKIIYSIHEPEVPCISKGKEHKKY